MKRLFFTFILIMSIMTTHAEVVGVDHFIRATWISGTVILDVRTEQEYNEGHIAGALLADVQQPDFVEYVKQKLKENGKEDCNRIALYCRSGKRSRTATLLLETAGYTVTELDGGILAWQAAEKKIVKGSEAAIARFRPHTYKVNKQMTLDYRDTQTGQGEADILVVYLHSSSACGTDNEKPARSHGLKQIISYLDRQELPAKVLVPQCRVDRRWNEYRPMLGCVMSEALHNLIKDYAKQNHIKKVYILGESFGGAGVWRMLTDYPKQFSAGLLAAAYPLRNVNSNALSLTPLCVIMGEKDTHVSLEKVTPVIEGIKERKGDLRYILLKDADHYSTCNKAFTDDNLNWMFSK